MEYQYLSDEAFLLEDFFSSHECESYIKKLKNIGFKEAPIETNRGSIIAKEIRNNERIMTDDSQLAKELQFRCKDYLPNPVDGWQVKSINERFRFYRYEAQQLFRWHRDGSFKRNENEESKLTFMVYLNEDFMGGYTNFREFKIKPKKGMALFFKHKILHEGVVVTEGVKYVLRTDVMYEKLIPA